MSITVALFAGVVWHFDPGPDASTSGVISEHRAAIAFVDVLMVASVSMLRTPAVTETARQLSNAYRRIRPRNPKRAAATLVAQLLPLPWAVQQLRCDHFLNGFDPWQRSGQVLI